MSLKFPNLPENLNPAQVTKLKAQDPREYFREWYTDGSGNYDQAPDWLYDACDWRKKPGAPAHYVHPPRRARTKNGKPSSLDRTTFHPALAEYSNDNPPHILYLWDRLDNGVPKSWPLPPKLVDTNGDVIMDTDPESGKQISCRFWAHAPERISRSPDLWLMEYLERVDSRMQRRDWIALMRSSELDGGHRPKANRINNILSEYRRKFNMQPWKPTTKSVEVLQKLINSGEIKKPSSGNSTRGISPGPKNPSRPWKPQSGRNYIPYPPGFDPDEYGSWNPWVDYKHLCHKKEKATKRMLEEESECGDTLPLSGPMTKRLKMKEKNRNKLAESDQDDDVLDIDVRKSQIKSPCTTFPQQLRTYRVSNELRPSSLIKGSCDSTMISLSALHSSAAVSQQSLTNMASITSAIALPVQDVSPNQYNLPSTLELKYGTINTPDIPHPLYNKEVHVRTLAPVQTGGHNAPLDKPLSNPNQILDAFYRHKNTAEHPTSLDPQGKPPIVPTRTTSNPTLHRPYQNSLEELRRIPIQHNTDVINDLHSVAGVHPDQLSQRYRELDKAASKNRNHYEFA